MTKKFLSLLLGIVLLSNSLLTYSQKQYDGYIIYNGQQANNNVIQTPVPFLNINPDSRAAGMGDIGAATSPDLNSLNFNAAKYAFLDDDLGFSFSYSPWLKAIANDINLYYLTLFKRFDKQSAGALGIRYFSLGQIIFTNEYNQYQGQKNPNEFTLDGSYSRLFSDRVSGGITFRYIRSDLSAGAGLSSGQAPTKAGQSVAVDISSYYHSPLTINNLPGELAFGINVSNLGAKISYTDAAVKDFIPANLRLGASVKMELDSYNKLTIALDINKLLVPTPPQYAVDSTGAQITVNGKPLIYKGMDPNVGVPQGVFQSFYDAPGGFSEEIKEYTLAGGLEYWYRDQFAIRGGYFNESAMKGNRKYMTIGLGLKMTLMTIDFSYLVPSAGSSSPLANTMRFTFSFNVGKPKKQKEIEN